MDAPKQQPPIGTGRPERKVTEKNSRGSSPDAPKYRSVRELYGAPPLPPPRPDPRLTDPFNTRKLKEECASYDAMDLARATASSLDDMPLEAVYKPQQAVYGPQQAVYGPQQAVYGPQQAVYGPHQAAYGPHQAADGPYQAAYGPYQAVYGPYQAVYGPHQAVYGLHQAVYGPQQAFMEAPPGLSDFESAQALGLRMNAALGLIEYEESGTQQERVAFENPRLASLPTNGRAMSSLLTQQLRGAAPASATSNPFPNVQDNGAGSKQQLIQDNVRRQQLHELERKRRPTNKNGIPWPDINCSVEICLIPIDAGLSHINNLVLQETGKIRSIEWISALAANTKSVRVVYVNVGGAQRLLDRFITQGLRLGKHELRVMPGFVHLYSQPPLASNELSRVLLVSGYGDTIYLPNLLAFIHRKVPDASLLGVAVSYYTVPGGLGVWDINFASINKATEVKKALKTDGFYAKAVNVVYGLDRCDIDQPQMIMSEDGMKLTPVG